MSARICELCGAPTILVDLADGGCMEIDVQTIIWSKEIDRDETPPKTFWAQMAQPKQIFGIAHSAVCRKSRR